MKHLPAPASARPHPSPLGAHSTAIHSHNSQVTTEKAQLEWGTDAPDWLLALGKACLAPEPEGRPSFADIAATLDARRAEYGLATA
jgi:hypothetical protein